VPSFRSLPASMSLFIETKTSGVVEFTLSRICPKLCGKWQQASSILASSAACGFAGWEDALEAGDATAPPLGAGVGGAVDGPDAEAVGALGAGVAGGRAAARCLCAGRPASEACAGEDGGVVAGLPVATTVAGVGALVTTGAGKGTGTAGVGAGVTGEGPSPKSVPSPPVCGAAAVGVVVMVGVP